MTPAVVLASPDRRSAVRLRRSRGLSALYGRQICALMPALIAACIRFEPARVLTLCVAAVLTAEIWRRVFGRTAEGEIAATIATSLLLALALPENLPAWQVVVGTSFGIVVGKEVFGGTGKHFLHPALVGVAFLHFAYPAAMRSGDVSGPIGMTSTLAAAVGAALLLQARAISWRVVAGAIVGASAAALVSAHLAISPAASLPWYGHLDSGGFAFILAFIVGDPVTSAATNSGRWIYGAFFGAMTILLRVANPGQAPAALMAALLASITAPLVDYGVAWANIRRRRLRRG
jgi:Na+-transporting NADH:ubiquinone oxidoreductase subunit B